MHHICEKPPTKHLRDFLDVKNHIDRDLKVNNSNHMMRCIISIKKPHIKHLRDFVDVRVMLKTSEL